MFLELPNHPLPSPFNLQAYTDEPLPRGQWGGRRPKHLVPLSRSMWPMYVQVSISRSYVAVGLKNPPASKLVEPYAIVFGGTHDDGAFNFTNVNWEMVEDYFRWEAHAIAENGAEAERLQVEAEKKYGGRFSHYPVYENAREAGYVACY